MTQANKMQEAVAAALNENGDIFRDEIIRRIQSGTGRQNLEWRFEASDVPVPLPNRFELRVDIVLKRRSLLPESVSERLWYMVMKCKRAAPNYDRWVFLTKKNPANRLLSNHYHIERAEAFGTHPPHYKHTLKTSNALEECPVFETFIETRIETPSNNYTRASSTVAIEGALCQVTLAQTGVANKLRRGQTQMFSLIPVVVTTAELMSAHVGDNCGLKIQPTDLKLEPRKWLALNYHVTDEAAQFFVKNHMKPTSIAEDLGLRQVRTVFVVQYEQVQAFLAWLGEKSW